MSVKDKKNIKDTLSVDSDKQKLLEKYQVLPLLHQQILQIRSLIFYKKRKSDVINYLLRSDLKMEKGGRPSKLEIRKIFSYLTKEGFLNSDGNLNLKITHYLAKLAVSSSNPLSESNLKIIKEVVGVKNISNAFDFVWEINQSHYQIAHFAIYANDTTVFSADKTTPIENRLFLIKAIYALFYIDGSDVEWLKTRDPIIQIYLCCAKLLAFYGNLSFLSSDTKIWGEFYCSHHFTDLLEISANIVPPYIHSKFLQVSLCMGLLEATQKKCLAFTESSFYQQEALATLAFFRGEVSTSLRHYGKAIKLFRTLANKSEWPRENLHAIFYVLILINQENINKARTVITNLHNISHHDEIASILEAFLHIKQNDLEGAEQRLGTAIFHMERSQNIAPFVLALYVWASCLVDPQNLTKNINEYKKNFLHYIEISHYLAAHLYAELVVAANNSDPDCSLFLNQNSPFGSLRFLDFFRVKQSWEYAVDQLHQIVVNKADLPDGLTENLSPKKRLVWLLNPDNLYIEIVEQRLQKNGGWSNGRSVSLKKLYRMDMDNELDYLSEQDKRAIQGLRQESYGWYGQVRFYLDPQETLKNLIGHPLVFHAENRNVSLELIKGELEIQVEKVANGYHLSLAYYRDIPSIILEQETTNRYRVLDFSENFVAIAKIVSKRGLTIPVDAKEKILAMICNTKSGICINSDLEDDSIPAIPGDTTCCVHLFPISDGMKLNLWMRPLGEQGHYYRATRGQERIITDFVDQDGKKIRKKVLRDFAKEKESVDSLISGCPTLAEFSEKSDDWYFESIETCLEVLLELEEYKKSHEVNVEWPKGQTLKLKQTVSFNDLSLSIKGKQDWFEYEGEIKLDHGLVLDMKGLLDIFDNYDNHGRFIKLNDGEFIALTEKFKKHLEDLKAISEGNKVYRLSTGVLQTLAEDTAQISSDQAWKKHLNRLQSMEKHFPAIPSTLQATLREYQEVGFKYLSRLANWEIGACLADDMGVGKTVQTIALLLELAPRGPILVVAPTSVCFVWLEELSKFAPTLNAYTLYDADDRKALVNSLDKMDILICSYGLLIQSEDVIVEKEWQVVVLDEAQAIKNHDTKRWKCATKLKSNRRIALTGTPIENHLGELWSIFRFLNPGLLGSLQTFQNRYAIPIERHKDAVAKRALKNLVHPYILRRTKTEVLKELPPKTEQSVLIEPTAEEAAFYEAARIKALQRIGQLDEVKDSKQANSKRFSILAEITRLRQACCHSSLVDENVNLESSKIKAFLNITENLIENNHKALVFSQYVRYLSKIKEILQNEKISYQYLDGSTPIKARQDSVAAFQQGYADLFLISLKAGGAGLNLTAADYVIILDPWWNPAVEEQASDRAHRIGQQRPVTIYRLIMKNSIEEKIVKLHKDKRDLADDLLSGSDISGKMTEDELMKLMEK